MMVGPIRNRPEKTKKGRTPSQRPIWKRGGRRAPPTTPAVEAISAARALLDRHTDHGRPSFDDDRAGRLDLLDGGEQGSLGARQLLGYLTGDGPRGGHGLEPDRVA